MCGECSRKLNFHHQKKEVTRKKKNTKGKKRKDRSTKGKPSEEFLSSEETQETQIAAGQSSAPSSVDQEPEPSTSTDIWRESQQTSEEKSRDEEFEEFLEDLFL